MKHVTAVGASLRRSIQSREDFGRLEHAPPLALVNQADNTFGKQIVEGGVGCRLRNSQAFDGLLYGQYRMPQQESLPAKIGRASRRQRVCTVVVIGVAAVAFKIKIIQKI